MDETVACFLVFFFSFTDGVALHDDWRLEGLPRPGLEAAAPMVPMGTVANSSRSLLGV